MIAGKISCTVETVHPPEKIKFRMGAMSRYVVLRVLAGRLDGGTVLKCAENGVQYRVEQFVLGGWRASAEGYWTVSLARIGPEATSYDLVAGMHLIGESS
jgi:hypothetical protein